MIQLIILAAVLGFLVGALITAVGCYDSYNKMGSALESATEYAHAVIENLRAELRESQKATADQAMRANKLMAKNRRLTKR